MKIYSALYCCCVHESSYATLSTHKSKEGAEKAVQNHKNEEKAKWERDGASITKEDPWDVHQAWQVEEGELLD